MRSTVAPLLATSSKLRKVTQHCERRLKRRNIYIKKETQCRLIQRACFLERLSNYFYFHFDAAAKHFRPDSNSALKTDCLELSIRLRLACAKFKMNKIFRNPIFEARPETSPKRWPPLTLPPLTHTHTHTHTHTPNVEIYPPWKDQTVQDVSPEGW